MLIFYFENKIKMLIESNRYEIEDEKLIFHRLG